MNGTLTYATTVNEHVTRDAKTLKRKVTYSANDVSTGIVWSPGPNAATVWVLPYYGASQSEAVSVHAPTPSKPFWHAESAPWGYSGPEWARQAVTLDGTLRFISAPRDGRYIDPAQQYRQDMAHAPALPRKTWQAALGVDNVAQLALEDVAA